MAKKKSMIPVAFIVTDEIPSRFEAAYASTLYETYEMQEALSANPKKTPAIFYFAQTLDMLGFSVPHNKIFAIYNPDPKRLTMAKIGDGDKVIVLISNMAALKNLEQIHSAAEKVRDLGNSFYRFAPYLNDVANSRNVSTSVKHKPLLKVLRETSKALPVTIQNIKTELAKHLITEFGI